MTLKNNSSIFETIDLTWPAEEFLELTEWKLRKSIKGGKRVSAATAIEKSGIPAIQLVENTLAEWCQDKLFMIKAGQNCLDEELQKRGYCIVGLLTIEGSQNVHILSTKMDFNSYAI